MNSRMSKYENIDSELNSRVKKNEDLYKNIAKNDLDNFNVHSNATVIGENNKNEIDIDKIKKILDTKYNEEPKRRSIRLEKEEIEDTKELEITKEYDINTILNKAKVEKTVNYEEERLKKLRDTQFDILNNLNVEKEEPKEKEEEINLSELINTITIHESKRKNDAPTEDTGDLFDDLRKTGHTEVTPVIEKSIEEIKSDKKELTSKVDISNTTKLDKTSKVDNTFYTANTKFNKKDFEDLEIEEKTKRNVVMEIVIVLILLVFVVGLYIFLKSVLNF